jgi:hypothetical protein
MQANGARIAAAIRQMLTGRVQFDGNGPESLLLDRVEIMRPAGSSHAGLSVPDRRLFMSERTTSFGGSCRLSGPVRLLSDRIRAWRDGGKKSGGMGPVSWQSVNCMQQEGMGVAQGQH